MNNQNITIPYINPLLLCHSFTDNKSADYCDNFNYYDNNIKPYILPIHADGAPPEAEADGGGSFLSIKYKNKYLKYKNKYLKLKEKYTKIN
jgi:hypothetical protein